MNRLLLSITALLASLQAGPLHSRPMQFCAEVDRGTTSEGSRVVICKKLHPSAPLVRLPSDQAVGKNGLATLYGTVELDVSERKSGGYHIKEAHFVDRNLKSYALVDATGTPVDEFSELMRKNYLPSNRVHYLLYEAKGRVRGPVLQIERLRPVVMIEGQAIDKRFWGAWEGTMSKRRGRDRWFTEPSEPENFAKVRVVFDGMVRHNNITSMSPSLPRALEDAARYKVVGRIENAKTGVRLSTGECAPALISYGARNPMPARVALEDYALKIWRFPAMHSLSTTDFHVVIDYPKGLYPSALAMASHHNFRLKDYVSPSTEAQELAFHIHGNPVDQLLVVLKPVRGGGGSCTP